MSARARSARRTAAGSALLGAVAAFAACGGGGGSDGPASGAEVFADAGCGDCHTLAAADATGTVGSSLDQTKLDPAAIAGWVRNGTEGMPPYEGRLSEEEIAAVSEYVVDSAAGPGRVRKNAPAS